MRQKRIGEGRLRGVLGLDAVVPVILIAAAGVMTLESTRL
jgi:hypothetical protein